MTFASCVSSFSSPAMMPARANSAASIEALKAQLDQDRLERRYRLVYPLNIFLENARQVVVVSAIGLVIAIKIYTSSSDPTLDR